MQTSRKLAAILFADIVGYTSLMQQDESFANVLLEKFHKTLNKKVPLHKGQVINNYGDGCVCTFDSAVDAMNCAKEIQIIFQKEPNVPVRIGLHSGDVLFKEKNVYGDAVNIASRIESLGVAGAVLFSKQIKRHISNQKEFEVQSLGEFHFKNVEKDMEVFALANEGFVVPKRGEMKGKLKTKKTNFSKLAIILPILLMLSFGGYWFFSKNNQQLPDSIQKARIAVLPYKNKTNNSELDVLGQMAADWIIQGMMNFDEIKVVSYQTIKDNLQYLSASAGGQASFQERTGTQKIIRGSYYQDGDQLIFQSQIVDASSGEIEFAFPEVVGSSTNTSALVKELRERILTYFSIQGNHYDNLSDNPPKFEAFQLMKEAETYFGNDYDKTIELLNQAIEIDSSFFFAYNQIFYSYSNRGKHESVDSMFQIIQQRFPRLTPYNKILVDFMKATMSNDLHERQLITDKLFKKDPKNLFNNYMAGLCAMHLNRPQKAVEYFSSTSPQLVPVDAKANTWWHSVFAQNLIRTNQLDKAMEVLNLVPTNKASNGIFYRKQEVYALRNESDSILQMINEMEQNNFPTNVIHDLYVESIEEFAILENKEAQMHWVDLAINKIKSQPESVALDKYNLAGAYFLSEQYEKALPLYRELVNESNGNPSLFRLRRLGGCHAYLGQTEAALDIIQEIKTRKAASTRSEGEFEYNIAAIYSMLGEKEKAVQYLKEAFQGGFVFYIGVYQYASEFLPLRGYPPFEEFVKPK